jgi:hypothetical protein
MSTGAEFSIKVNTFNYLDQKVEQQQRVSAFFVPTTISRNALIF